MSGYLAHNEAEALKHKWTSSARSAAKSLRTNFEDMDFANAQERDSFESHVEKAIEAYNEMQSISEALSFES